MTLEEQRIAIAEACGWTDCKIYTNTNDVRPGGRWMGQLPTTLPDYLNDLNAMHEAEKTLRNEQRFEFYKQLLKACEDSETVNTIHATAAQRAEAFLKTLGKWKE